MNTQLLSDSLMAARRAASNHFVALLERQPKLPPVADLVELRPCALRISTGLHTGATLRLNGAVTLGSAADNDVVLHDPGVRAHHAELRRVDGVWALIDLDGNRVVRPIETATRGRFVRSRHGLGAAELVFTQSATVRVVRRKLRQAASRALAPLLLVSAVALSVVVAVQLVQPAVAHGPSVPLSLASAGFADVKVVSSHGAQTLVVGYVDDLNGLGRLNQWLGQHPELGPLSLQVRVGTELTARVQEALDDPALSVDYQPGGIVRVQGSTNNMASRERLRRLTADLAGVVRVDDRVAFAVAPEPPLREHVLPVRVVDVIPGEHGSFGSGNGGARYFVGGVLPDGAEVVAIRADAIEFSVGTRRLVYEVK